MPRLRKVGQIDRARHVATLLVSVSNFDDADRKDTPELVKRVSAAV
jgi:hypothetical protein